MNRQSKKFTSYCCKECKWGYGFKGGAKRFKKDYRRFIRRKYKKDLN